MAPLRFVCMMREESAPGTASVREATNASALSLVMSARRRFWVFSRREVGGESWGGIGISGVEMDLSKIDIINKRLDMVCLINPYLVCCSDVISEWVHDFNKCNEKHISKSDIWTDDVGKFSLSHESCFARLYSHIVMKCGIDQRQTFNILDGMAGVGGDSSGLMFFFPNSHLVSNEIDMTRFHDLQHNINKLQSSTDQPSAQISFSNLNVLDLLFRNNTEKQEFDIVYLDPPWGGRDYKTHPHRLEISGIDLVECCQTAFSILSRLRLVILKVPNNLLKSQLNDLKKIPFTTVEKTPVQFHSHHSYDIITIWSDQYHGGLDS